MQVILNPASIADYRTFLRVKGLPTYRIRGRVAWFPDEYIDRVMTDREYSPIAVDYEPPAWAYDYQRDISRIAIAKRRYCLFIECGLGKTIILLEFAHHANRCMAGKRALIVSPLMVVSQTIEESRRFYPNAHPVVQVRAAGLQEWLHGKDDGTIGITNYEAIRPELDRGNLGCLILDESSMLKSHYGKWGTKLLEMGAGLEWKLCATGTPAPNDRIEYANHAVFMGAFPNVNAFLATFFVNKGQTQERWVMKPHAIEPFYRALSHWAIFMTNPATYGWKDNSETIPPIFIHEHDVPLTAEQSKLAYDRTGRLFADKIGGISNRSVLSQIAKGYFKGKPIASKKPGYIRNLVESWPDESTLVWCRFNAEQDRLAAEMPDAGSIDGETPEEKRLEMIKAFKAGELRTLVTKPKILGFGLNLQKATRQVFSACDDSYEDFHQCVKRSNRVSSTRPLNVHIPVTDIERIQMENVLRKARMVQADTDEQERIFRKATNDGKLQGI